MQHTIRYSIVATVSASFLMPAVAFGALDGSWIDSMIKTASEGNGTVIIQNSSSVSTGGQSAGSGESVVTDDASASSRIETKINSSNSGGKVEIRVETERNGDVTTQEYSKELKPGENIEVRVATSVSATSKPQRVGVQNEVSTNGASSSAVSEVSAGDTAQVALASEATLTVGDDRTERPRIAAALMQIPKFFARFFASLWFF